MLTLSADNKVEEKEKVSLEKKLQDSFKYEPNQSPKNNKTKAKPAPTSKGYVYLYHDS